MLGKVVKKLSPIEILGLLPVPLNWLVLCRIGDCLDVENVQLLHHLLGYLRVVKRQAIRIQSHWIPMSKLFSEVFEELDMVIAFDGFLSHNMHVETITRNDSRSSDVGWSPLEIDNDILIFPRPRLFLEIFTREVGFIKIVYLQVVAMSMFDGSFEIYLLIDSALKEVGQRYWILGHDFLVPDLLSLIQLSQLMWLDDNMESLE
jgi:hypothetical protein